MKRKLYLPDGASNRLEELVRSKMYVQDFAHELGVSRSTVYEWFNGADMSVFHLFLACELLGVSADYIIFGGKE